mmetsp:Transcript_31979/g.50995  ORF Transcript_31979/g.50995 Transcript_31979/m.50995 type:complete len:86 (-) Transcript_31979:57-314(-)
MCFFANSCTPPKFTAQLEPDPAYFNCFGYKYTVCGSSRTGEVCPCVPKLAMTDPLNGVPVVICKYTPCTSQSPFGVLTFQVSNAS